MLDRADRFLTSWALSATTAGCGRQTARSTSGEWRDSCRNSWYAASSRTDLRRTGLFRQALGDGLVDALIGAAPVEAMAGPLAVSGQLAAAAADGKVRDGAKVPEGQRALEQGVAP